ncbi:uracil-DNA glycosylase [Aquincola sp. MAHUQ-54]|uniref:Type-4 uracil-DNA glycosylase n=1 Tax=Aquincola agrisoli TaxID=3119538 RepID=A0AAW9Q5G5_9BURK
MRWNDRQRAMLGEMGIRLFEPPGHAAGQPPPADDAPAAPVERPVEVAAAAPPAAAAAAPGPSSIATLDWQPLREAVAACTACPLCASRRNTVFGVGNTRAHWMIVGEAPGEQEDRLGEPFVGPAGQLLDSMLQALGLTRAEAPPAQQVFIANTLKCRPPRNRNPEPAELARCEPYLQRQIALVQPRVILAMGRFAVQALLRSSEPIGRLRGRVHQYEGVPLVVTYHPAYLLRQPADKARSWDDLCLAAQVLEGRLAPA